MATPIWQAGVLYPPGSLVQPATSPGNTSAVITNNNAETGDVTGWEIVNIVGDGLKIASNGRPFSGTYSFFFRSTTGGTSQVVWINENRPVVRPGQAVTARALIALDDTGGSANRGAVRLYWYRADNSYITYNEGYVVRGNNSSYRSSQVTANAPADAAYVAVAVWTQANNNGGVRFDEVTWNYNYQQVNGLIYRAVQPAAGYSSNVEPVWPSVLGVQVIDNEVIWEAVLATRIVWQAVPIMKSGPDEPVWPTEVGGEVADNTIIWKLVNRAVTDTNCPNTRYVVIDQGKVYAGDDDIVAFCATNKPRDWTSRDDAGYLPFGLGAYGDNPIRAMGLYRGNLFVANAKGFQLWQIDPDPALNSRLDALAIPSIYHRAFASVVNDAYFLTHEGVRTLGIAASSTSIKSNDVGVPIDTLVKAKLAVNSDPIGMNIPGLGQYWLCFPYENDTDRGTTEVFVYTVSQLGSVGAWSRYIFPFSIEYWAIDGAKVVFRNRDSIIELDPEAALDLAGSPEAIDFPGLIQWPWLEPAMLGTDVSMECFDIVGDSDYTPSVAFGYNQRDPNVFTAPFEVMRDSLDGQPIPFELTAPSISPRVTYNGGRWEFSGLALYVQGRGLAK